MFAKKDYWGMCVGTCRKPAFQEASSEQLVDVTHTRRSYMQLPKARVGSLSINVSTIRCTACPKQLTGPTW